MPIGEPQAIAMMPGQINVPTDNGLFISVSVQSDGSPEGMALVPATVQSLIDLFQGWEGRLDVADVAGQLYDTQLSSVTPTNPIPPPDPPEDPPGE